MMEQPTILMIASNYPPRIGGPATTVPQLAKILGKTHNTSVVAFHEKNIPWFEQTTFKLYRSPSVYLFGFSNPLSVLIRTILLSVHSRIVALRENPKIIHAHDSHISAVAGLFTKFTSLNKRKVIVKYAGDLVVEFSGLSENEGKGIEEIIHRPSLKQKLLFRLQKTILKLSDVIQVQNNYQKKIVQKFYEIPEKQIAVIPNPIDLNKFKPMKVKKNKNKFVLLTVSRLVPWKGLETLIKALPLAIKKNPFIELWIIGEGQPGYEKRLKSLCCEEGIEKRVKFLGKVPNERLPYYYNYCNALVQPSIYEPFGITVVEAMACGKPVIASNVGGLKKLVKNGINGFLFESKNHVQLAGKINSLIKLNAKQMGVAAKKSIIKYSYQNIISKLKQIYSN